MNETQKKRVQIITAAETDRGELKNTNERLKREFIESNREDD